MLRSRALAGAASALLTSLDSDPGLNAEAIDWIEAAGNYACVNVGRDTHIMRRSLAELERDLGDEKFIRMHRSAIVTFERIRTLELQNGGEYEVVLGSEGRLQLSRRFRKRLHDRMGVMTARV